MALEKMELDLTAGQYSVRFGGEVYDQGTYEVSDTGVTLYGMNGPNAGRTIPSIFKFSGDGLSICYGLSGKRPAKFTTRAGQELYLVNYVRKQT